jgi:hypothetical protein
MKPNQRLDKELSLGQISHLAWVEKSEIHSHPKWDMCGNKEERISKSQVAFSLWELDSWGVRKHVQIKDFYVIKKVSIWL